MDEVINCTKSQKEHFTIFAYKIYVHAGIYAFIQSLFAVFIKSLTSICRPARYMKKIILESW